MNRRIFHAAALIALIAPSMTLAESWKRIKTEEDFRAAVVDRKGENENGWVKLKSNGAMTGNIKGQGKLRGKWAWGNGFFCRNIKVGKTDLGQNCQLVEMAGNKVRYTRDQGKGQRSVWTIK